MSSRHYSFRLHPENEYEKEAIKILDDRLRNSDIRSIITDALLRSEGYEPSMFSKTKSLTAPLLEGILTEFGKELLRELRGSGIRFNSRNENTTSFDEDDDEDIAQNLAAGFMNRRRK